jgi:hypothetical protein
MSNTLIIEAVEVKYIGSDKIEYGVIATDTHASVIDIGYESEEELYKVWPSRLEAARKVFKNEAFLGVGHVNESNQIVLHSCSVVIFEGFPEQQLTHVPKLDIVNEPF